MLVLVLVLVLVLLLKVLLLLLQHSICLFNSLLPHPVLQHSLPPRRPATTLLFPRGWPSANMPHLRLQLMLQQSLPTKKSAATLLNSC